jgi:hypothetical protein
LFECSCKWRAMTAGQRGNEVAVRVDWRRRESSVRPHWASKNAQTSSIAWADAVKVNEEKSSLGSTLPNWSTLVDRV